MTMIEKISPEKEAAVRRLISGFDAIPADWAALAAKHKDEDEFLALPMWGTLFLVGNMDRGNIEKLLIDPVPKDIHGLIGFMEDYGIEPEAVNAMELIALSASALDEIDDDVVCDLRATVLEEWRDSGDEDAMLATCGWYDVGSTGIIAREIDGELLLGINGAGYSFFDSHWVLLYDELGYSWH